MAGARAAGLEASVEVLGEAVDLPSPVDVAAYRIVQEALTNVIRHAGASRVAISVGYTGSAVTLEIDDNGHGAGASGAVPPASGNGQAGQASPAGQGGHHGLPGHGSGIVGMRERAQALGGALSAGPGQGGGFTVVATLPVGRPPEPSP